MLQWTTSQRRLLAQHSVAILEQCCNHLKQCRNDVATLCCAKNRRCESSRVTSPLSTWVKRVSFLTSAINWTRAWKSFLNRSSNSAWPLSPTALKQHQEVMNLVSWISMCNQMVTSEIGNNFTRVLSKSVRLGKLLGFGQNASEIIP